MKRITKLLASEIASKILSEKKQKLSDLKKEHYNLIVDYCNSMNPKVVMEFSKKYHDYLNKGSVSIILCGKHIGYYSFVHNKMAYNIDDQDLSDKHLKLTYKISRLDDSIKQAEKQLSDTIFKLTTYKKIREHFPEASKYLPEDSKENIPAINIPELMDKINKL